MHCRERERVFRFLCSALAFFVSINWFFAQPAQGFASDAQLQAQKEEYQEKIAAADSRLNELKDEKDRAQDYCDLLEQKITYLQEELALCEQEVENAKNDIAAINNRIINNENSVKTIEKRSESVKIQIDALTETLASVYDEWCARMRAAYISGRYTLLELLLTSDGPAALLTRLEMISAVSRHDGKIMQTVSSSIDKITALQAQLQTDAAKLQAASEQLRADEAARKEKRSDYLALEEELAAKKAVYDEEKAESDLALKKLTEKTKMYSEYRNESAEELERIEKEIQAQIGDAENQYKGQKPASGDVLDLIYPVPGHTTISAGYPNYSSGKYHGGIDFPCDTGTDVVAAQAGTVITAKTLDYSYGYYIMLYHGEDEKGRSVVTLYGHNSELLVQEGQTVAQGEVIAKSGSTGNSTGPHCHFEVRLNKERVDPLDYLE